MVTQLPDTMTMNPTAAGRVGSLTQTAEALHDNAVDQAREKLPLPLQNEELATLLARRDFIQYFKHALAHEVAGVLGTYDGHVHAVYLFDDAINPDAETEDDWGHDDLTVHLLVKVNPNSAALEALTAALDRALTAKLRALPSATFANYSSFLDVIPVTERTIQERRGYAALLSSFYARPLELWTRA